MSILDNILAPFRRLRESTFASGYDPDINLTAAQMGSAYTRRLTKDGGRDLDPLTQSRAQAIAYWLWDTNPLAKRVLELTADFVLGEGVTVDIAGEGEEPHPGQIVIDRFWNDPMNELDLWLRNYVLELGLYGEFVPSVAVNATDGSVTLGYIDPGRIKEVVPDPDDPKRAAEIVLSASLGQPEKRLKVIKVDMDPNSESYRRLVEPAAGESCFFFAINKVSNATRGRSDLLTLADWIDAYDQVLFGEVDRALLLKSFIWDVTLTGMDQKGIDDYSRKNASPKPGSVRYHNEKVLWAAVTPDLKAADAQAGADMLLSYVATGSGHPKTWLSGVMDVNKATSGALEEPAIKRVAARQLYVRYILTYILRFVLDQAELHGRIPRRPNIEGTIAPEPWPITVTMPSIRNKDLLAAGQTIAQVTNALVAARADDAIDLETEQEVLVTLIGQLGIDVDLEGMRERIEAAQAEKQAQAASAPRIWPPMAAEVPGTEQPQPGSNGAQQVPSEMATGGE